MVFEEVITHCRKLRRLTLAGDFSQYYKEDVEMTEAPVKKGKKDKKSKKNKNDKKKCSKR